MTKFFQKSQKNSILVPFWALMPKLEPKMNFPGENGAFSFLIFELLTIMLKSERPNEPFLRKLLGGTHQKPVYFITFFMRYSKF